MSITTPSRRAEKLAKRAAELEQRVKLEAAKGKKGGKGLCEYPPIYI
jgi:hypothetical protein